MYKLFIRPLLFLINPENVHHITFGFLRFACAIPGIKALLQFIYDVKDPRLEKKLLGHTFPNRVGLAAGFDKNARCLDELACFGFGFIEIGTITPQAQTGNEKPRLFRLSADEALINRMGFNNDGALAVADRLKRRKSSVLVGGNIGRNKITDNDKAAGDYAYCMEVLYPWVDYFVVNVSSPNTPGLRELQEKEPLRKLLSDLKALSDAKEKPKPLLLKISPDLSKEQLDDALQILKDTKMDGIIVSNTTTSRDRLKTASATMEECGAGGLSGKPLAKRSNEMILYIRRAMGPLFPIIGVGGIMSAQDALDKIAAGADLIQVYTGFVYEGPGFVKRINRAITSKL